MKVNIVRYVFIAVVASLLIGGGLHLVTHVGRSHQSAATSSSKAAANPSTNVATSEGGDNSHKDSSTPESTLAQPRSSSAVVKRPAVYVFGLNGQVQLEDVPDGRFKNELRNLSEEARRYALDKLGKLHVPLNDVASLNVEKNGQLFYQCNGPRLPPPPREVAAAQSEAAPGLPSAPVVTVAAATVPIATPPVRHSRPGATKVIYLDFNGHTITGTAWNNEKGAVGDANYRPAVASYVAKPFDIDSDPTSFNDAEQGTIILVWERVAEDYRGFDVDVTTEEPAVFTATTGRVLITSNTDANSVLMPSWDSAGVAYLDVFGNANYVSYLSPALVYANKNYNNESYIAEAVSHEMGHNLSLSHDGTIGGDEYYAGHGYGDTSWGAIMGAAYDKNVTQWSKGEYFNANNPQDDLAIIAGHLGYIPDDRTDSNATATPLTVSGVNVAGTGIISQTDEADRFSFDSGPGAITLYASPYRNGFDTSGGNLDAALELYDSSGNLVASVNEDAFTYATLSTTVIGGTYYLRVVGVGSGSPMNNPPTGYTSYGSLGQYTISGTIVAPIPTAPAITSQPTNQSVSSTQAAQFTLSASGYPALTYRWQRLPAGSATWSDLADGGSYSGVISRTLAVAATVTGMSGDQFRCVATNGNGSATTNAVTLTVTVTALPKITGQPSSQTILAGNPVTFSVVATGVPAPTFQWQKNGTNITGATGNSYTIANVTVGNPGNYTAVATNSAGSATSNPAVLSVIVAPSNAIISIKVE